MCVNKNDSSDIIKYDHDLSKHYNNCSGTEVTVKEDLGNGTFKLHCGECGLEFVEG